MAQDPWAEFRLPSPQPVAGSPPLNVDAAAGRQPVSAQQDEWADFRLPPARERGALDVATQIPVGFNDALATVGGAPVDAATWLLNQIPGVNIKEPFAGSGSIKRGMGVIGANPDDRPATTPAEHIARGAGAGVAMMAGPELAVAGLARAGALRPSLVEMSERIFGSSKSVAAAAKAFTVGGAGGAGGVAAEQAVPEPYKPLAALGGGLAGGVAGALGSEVPAAVAAGARTAGRFVAPLTQGGRERLAGQTLAENATNPEAVRARLNEGVDEIIPGSRPTTFQATGDMGLGGLEREAATRDPAAFLTRRAEQNTARTSVLESIQPQGSPSDVSAFFRAQLKALDDATQSTLDEAKGRAQAAAASIGGARSPDAAGEAILSRVEPQRQALEATARESTAGIGGQGQAQEYGATIRGSLSDANFFAKQREGLLWRAVDPDGSLALDVSPLRQAAVDLRRALPQTARPIDGEEAAILETIAGLRPVMPFADVTALRTRVNDAMKQARMSGDSQALARLTSLRSGVENVISDTIERRAAQEADAVARGEIAPDETLSGRIEAWARDTEAGATSLASGAETPGTAMAPAFGSARTTGHAGIGSGSAAGGPGLPGHVGGGRAASAGRSPGRQPAPQSLSQFIASNGGLELTDDARHMDFHKFKVPGAGNLAREGGKSIDGFWRETLIREGYLPPEADGYISRDIRSELFDLLQNEALGRKTYRSGEEGLASVRAPRDDADLWKAQGDIVRAHEAEGLRQADLDPRILNEASELLARGGERDPLSAYERAAMMARDEGNVTALPVAPARRPPEEGLQPNFDEAARDRLQRATEATKERKRLFNEGPIGKALKTLGYRDNFAVSEDSVPGIFFRPGDEGARAIRVFRQAVGHNDQSLDPLQNYAAMSLRRAAEGPDGTLEPGAYRRWMSKHKAALGAFPRLRDRFATAALASEALQNFRPFRAGLSPSVIPEVYFHAGPSGFDGVQQLRRTIGDSDATSILSDYAASRLRAVATRNDGTIDPGKFQTWRRSHADALRALPGLEQRFATAADATEAVGQAAVRRKETLDTYQAGAIGRLIGVDDPQDVVRQVGNIFGRSDAVATMNRLAAEAGKDPAAKEGLRKAVADYIMGRFISNTEAGTSGASLLKADGLMTFVNQNKATLSRVLDPTAVGLLRRIAVDLRQANRSVASTKLPGGSNTPQDVIRELRKTGDAPLLRVVLGAAAGGAGFATSGGVGMLAGTLGAYVVTSMRNAGLQKVDDLIAQAMLRPDLARALFNKVPTRASDPSAMPLRQALNRASVFAATGDGLEGSDGQPLPIAAGGSR